MRSVHISMEGGGMRSLHISMVVDEVSAHLYGGGG